jgi:hypothetical protein
MSKTEKPRVANVRIVTIPAINPARRIEGQGGCGLKQAMQGVNLSKMDKLELIDKIG